MNERLMPLHDLSKTIQKRRIEAMRRRDSIEYALNSLVCLLIIAVAVITFLWVFPVRTVHGNDMFPSMTDGDIVLCNAKKEYVKNDIVCYTVDEETHIGRVVAKGGDTIRITEGGAFLVNGMNQTGEIIYPTYAPGKVDVDVEVPVGSVYILGDFRLQAQDSRFYGAIPLEDVEHKVVALLRHRKF